MNHLRSFPWRRRATFAGVVFLALAGPAGQGPARSAEPLRWGGDQSGGGPYIFEKNGRLTGFEVELARLIANKLGRPEQFVQSEWDKLPDLLTRRKDIDLILNGYEFDRRHLSRMSATLPYYLYRLRLLVHADDVMIRDWDDLRARPGERPREVGVLSESAASRYLKKAFGDAIGLHEYTEVINAFDLVQKHQTLDATVQDQPVVQFYAREFPRLKVVGAAAAPNYYVMYVRQDDGTFRDRINDILRTALKDGSLREIYDRYGLWNEDQERLADVYSTEWPPPEADGDKDVPEGQLSRFVWDLSGAAGMTVLLACLSMPLAIAVGVMVAVGRLYGPPWLAWVLTSYVELIRGTPLLFQLFAIFYLLPSAGIIIPPFWSGVLGLALNYSACEAENYRAGLLAIPVGQFEAAQALGMDRLTALRVVILPQAMRIVIPPVTNDFIALFKDTSVCSVIAVTELQKRYSILYNDHPSRLLELTLLTACLYLLMSYPLSLLARRLERKG